MDEQEKEGTKEMPWPFSDAQVSMGAKLEQFSTFKCIANSVCSSPSLLSIFLQTHLNSNHSPTSCQPPTSDLTSLNTELTCIECHLYLWSCPKCFTYVDSAHPQNNSMKKELLLLPLNIAQDHTASGQSWKWSPSYSAPRLEPSLPRPWCLQVPQVNFSICDKGTMLTILQSSGWVKQDWFCQSLNTRVPDHKGNPSGRIHRHGRNQVGRRKSHSTDHSKPTHCLYQQCFLSVLFFSSRHLLFSALLPSDCSNR